MTDQPIVCTRLTASGFCLWALESATKGDVTPFIVLNASGEVVAKGRRQGGRLVFHGKTIQHAKFTANDAGALQEAYDASLKQLAATTVH